MAVNGTAVALSVVGGVLLYSAVKGKGIGVTVHSLLAGQPVPNAATGGSGGSVQSAIGTMQGALTAGSQSAEGLINQELKKGNPLPYTRAQRAGIMGNIQAESNFLPGAQNPNGAYGICQWMGTRLDMLHWYAKVNNASVNDLATQIGFMNFELDSTMSHVQAAIRATNDPAHAATIFNNLYEISGDNSGQREANAVALYRSAVTA